jgi:hypothetical protein
MDQFFEEVADQRLSDTKQNVIGRIAGQDGDLARGGCQHEIIHWVWSFMTPRPLLCAQAATAGA